MITEDNAVKVETGGMKAASSFKIKADGKAFHLIFAGMYSDPVRAIIREILSNGTDSHAEAGCPDRPVKMQLPSRIDETFAIRDYGVSMTDEFVNQRFNTAFESTKDSSNTMLGGFGIGGKTPFVYTDTFSLRCWLDGKCRVYNAHLDENGCPAIVPIAEFDSDEERGVEVSFPVKPKDFNLFIEKAIEVAIPMKVRPQCSNEAFNQALDKIEKAVVVDEDGVKIIATREAPSPFCDTVLANIGGVLYPINYSELDDTSFLGRNVIYRAVQRASYCAFVDFPIGELTVTPSREQLVYNDKTKQAIRTRLEEASNSLLKQAKKKIDTMSAYDATREESVIKVINRSSVSDIPIAGKWRLRTSDLNFRHRNHTIHDVFEFRSCSVMRRFFRHGSCFVVNKVGSHNRHLNYSGNPGSVFFMLEDQKDGSVEEQAYDITNLRTPLVNVNFEEKIYVLCVRGKAQKRVAATGAIEFSQKNGVSLANIIVIIDADEKKIALLYRSMGSPSKKYYEFKELDLSDVSQDKVKDVPVLRYSRWSPRQFEKISARFISRTNRKIVMIEVDEDNNVDVNGEKVNKRIVGELCEPFVEYYVSRDGSPYKGPFFVMLPTSRKQDFLKIVKPENVISISDLLKKERDEFPVKEYERCYGVENTYANNLASLIGNSDQSRAKSLIGMLKPKAAEKLEKIISKDADIYQKFMNDMGDGRMQVFNLLVKFKYLKHPSPNKKRETRASVYARRIHDEIKKRNPLLYRLFYDRVGYFPILTSTTTSLEDQIATRCLAPALVPILNSVLR